MAAGATYTPIATQTLGTAASTITFSSIPSTYTDLRLVIAGKAATGLGSNAFIRFNGSTTGYSLTQIKGDGASATSTRTTSASGINAVAGISVSDAQPQLFTFDIFSYTSAVYKSVLLTYSGDLNGSGNTISSVGLWQNTTAISSVVFLGSTFAIGTTATLYGIAAA